MRRARQVSIATRTRQLYETAKRRSPPGFTLEEFRTAYSVALRQRPFCNYCRATLSEANVSLDHFIPVARGGGNVLANIHFICRGCNKAKGDFTHQEFQELLIALDRIGVECRAPDFRNKVIGALRAANSFRIGANRRAKQAR